MATFDAGFKGFGCGSKNASSHLTRYFVVTSISRQACSFAADDGGFGFASDVDFNFDFAASPLGFTWTSGFPPTVGGLVWAIAVAEYRTKTTADIVLISPLQIPAS